MRMTQRITALLTAMILLLTMLPGTALAEAFGDEFVFTDDLPVFSDDPIVDPFIEVPEVPTEAPTAEPTATPTEKPTAEPTATPTEKPTAEPTATPTEEPTSKPTAAPATPVPFQAGLARLAAGARLYESQRLNGAYQTADAGVVYAEAADEDREAIRIQLNTGNELLTAWVKAEQVTLLTDDETVRYDAEKRDETLIRTSHGHELLPIAVRSSDAAPVIERPVIVLGNTGPVDIPQEPVTPAASDKPASQPTKAPERSEELTEGDFFFTDELIDETVALPSEDDAVAPDTLPDTSTLLDARSLETPTNLKAQHNRVGKLTLSWTGTEDAQAYLLQYKGPGQAEYQKLAITEHTSYSTTTLDPTVVYYFRVLAVELDVAGEIINQSPASVSIPYIVLGDAKINDPRGKDTSTIRLTWSAVEGANLYDVMMSVHGKNEWKTVRTDLVTDYCDIKDLSFDETYDFRVVPKRKLDNGLVLTGNSSRVVMVGSPMETPSFTNYEWTDKGVRLTWDAIPGASGYVIYRRSFNDDPTNYRKLVVLDEPVTTYLDQTMTPGLVYYYFVYSFKLCSPEGWRCFSLKGDIGMGIWLPEVKDFKAVGMNSTYISLSWAETPGANAYQVFLSNTAGATPSATTTTAKTQLYQQRAVVGQTYYYRIRPVRTFSNGDVSYGAWSDELAYTHQLNAPTYRALLIGNTYPNQYPDMYLPGCDNDVDGMAQMLSRMTATPYQITKKINVTDGGILNAIQTTFSGAQANDISLFYYSGHGASQPGTMYHGSLVGVRNTFLSISRLKEELDKIPGRKVVILDSCHSGAAIGKSTDGLTVVSKSDLNAFNSMVVNAFAAGSSQIKAAPAVSDTTALFIEELDMVARGADDLANSGYYVITASRSDEQSVSTGYDQNNDGQIDKYFGLFTYGLTYGSGWNMAQNAACPLYADGLDNTGRVADGKINLYEAYRYALAAAKEQNPGQTAQIYPANSGLVIWAK